MTSLTISKPERLQKAQFAGRAIGPVAIVLCSIMLAGCGRKGAPEFDSGEPVAKPVAQQNQLIPGLNVPQKSATAAKPVKPKGNFILDPLL